MTWAQSKGRRPSVAVQIGKGIPSRATATEAMSVMPKLLLTELEAANSLGICARQLWALRKSGQIGYVPFGKTGVRYLPEQLAAWIAAAKVDRKDAE